MKIFTLGFYVFIAGCSGYKTEPCDMRDFSAQSKCIESWESHDGRNYYQTFHRDAWNSVQSMLSTQVTSSSSGMGRAGCAAPGVSEARLRDIMEDVLLRYGFKPQRAAPVSQQSRFDGGNPNPTPAGHPTPIPRITPTDTSGELRGAQAGEAVRHMIDVSDPPSQRVGPGLGTGGGGGGPGQSPELGQ